MNTVTTFIFFGIMGLLVGTQLKKMCYSCGLDVLVVFGVVRKVFFYALYTLLVGVVVLLSVEIVSLLFSVLF